MEGRWRNVNNTWADKLWLTVRRKDVSSCSEPITSSNPLSVISAQLKTCSSWSLQHTSNMTCQRTQNDSIVVQWNVLVQTGLSKCGDFQRLALSLSKGDYGDAVRVGDGFSAWNIRKPSHLDAAVIIIIIVIYLTFHRSTNNFKV